MSRCGQSTTCKDDARSPGAFVHGSMRHIHQTQVTSKCRHGPHTHTHTFTHAYRHTHMPHAFTHTEQIKQVDCTAQCRRDAATSGFKICLSFLVMNAKGFFSLFFFFRLNEGFRKLNKCLFRACLWLRNCANTLQCAFCGTKKTR